MALTAKRKSALVPVSLIWLGVTAAAVFAAVLRGVDFNSIWPAALAAAIPALLTLLLAPKIHREWAQVIVVLAWLALAVLGVLTVSFVPMALLFLCAPAIAALFERDKVVEALAMAVALALALFFAQRNGLIPETIAAPSLKSWGQQLGIFATLSMVVSALMASSHSRGELSRSAATKAVTGLAPDQLDIVPGSYFLIGRDERVKSLNSRARKNFDLKGKGSSKLANMLGLNEAAARSVTDLISRARTVGEERSGQFLVSADEENPKYWRFVASPQVDGNVGVAIHELDSTYKEIAQLQRESEKSRQAIEDKNLFFAGVSHELRTPLNAIIGFSDIMESRLFGPLPSKYAEYAGMIHDSGQHMLDLLSDVLDMEKVGAGKYELNYDHFQAADVIRSTMKMIRPTADKAHVTLTTDLPDSDDIIVEADRRAVRQILINLISNAVKFSPKGASVNVSAERVGDRLRMVVEDQGAGMSQDLIDKIGEPYLQSKDGESHKLGGTGLGLSLVKSLAELHRGQLSIDSAKGQGTRAIVDLPLERSKKKR